MVALTVMRVLLFVLDVSMLREWRVGQCWWGDVVGVVAVNEGYLDW